MKLRLLPMPLAIFVTACGAPSAGEAQPGNSATPAEQVAARPFETAEVTRFGSPWAMDFLPGRGSWALVTELTGKLWLVDAANGQRLPVENVPAVHVAGQGGLGDVVAAPDFATSKRIYLSWVEAGEAGTSGAVVAYATLENRGGREMLDGLKVIWRQDPKVAGNGHFSHRLAFAPDGSLFISSGERQKFDPAQDRNVDLGKVIHLTGEGERVGGRFYTMGHRNILGLAFAPDGRLWETEMGPKGGDELNLILPGLNYGWPKVSNGSHYDGRDIPDHRSGDSFEAPKAYWNPSISPAGLLIYKGAMFQQWQGDALIPALSGQALIRVDVDGDTARKADEWDMSARIRAVDEGPDGAVYLLEDGESGGRLLRLTPAR